ncbi:MAG: peptidoglycan-binding domain-containing protein [Clostridia bacterium]|nr:peptidoglycan-binding domain-containing protein [Clostridia bacterium]
MFCPHCHNKIPDGSNICPLCYANLAGVKPQAPREEPRDVQDAAASAHKTSAQPRAKKNTAYTKGSRGSRKSADRTPMIIAFGLILILVIIIAMIIRSMFSAGTPAAVDTPVPQAADNNTPEANNFIVFGAATATPETHEEVTPEPSIEITPTPAPETTVTLSTLRKGDQGAEVVTLQKALVELGFLTGATDGNFGTATQTAVKNFQKAYGLDDDGIAGKLTLEALYNASSVTPMPQTTPVVEPGDIMDLPG